MFGLKMELMVCAGLVGGTKEQSSIFPEIICKYQWYEIITNCLHHTSAVPQPFLLLIAANLALAGFLGWKRSLWPVSTRLAVQRSKDVFFLTLYDSINYMKHFRNVYVLWLITILIYSGVTMLRQQPVCWYWELCWRGGCKLTPTGNI